MHDILTLFNLNWTYKSKGTTDEEFGAIKVGAEKTDDVDANWYDCNWDCICLNISSGSVGCSGVTV